MTWLLDRIREWGDTPALALSGRPVTTYRDLVESSSHLQRRTRPGQVVALEGDYNLYTCAQLLALIEQRAIIIPLAPPTKAHQAEFVETAQAEIILSGQNSFDQGRVSDHPLYVELRERGTPGLVLFSSGSTGKRKAAVHDLGKLIDRHKKVRVPYCTLTFLLFDHVGGINTLLYTFANGGMIVSVKKRDPDHVCEAIERFNVELLPTSPTFLNMMLISEAHERHDLSSLKLITYGTEPMPASTLARLREIMPDVRLKQTYGLSELGILGTRSREDGTLWMKVGGKGFETKIQNGTLWIRAESAMLGYLNAPSPFDKAGWMDTGDVVEQDGEWLRILGRDSEVINVGGEKVYPAEVESVLLQMPGVKDAAVYGKANALTGQIVAVDVVAKELDKSLIQAFCTDRLARYKIPRAVRFVDTVSGDRFKRVRHGI